MNRKVFIPQLPTRFDKATNSRIPAIDANPATQFGELVVLVGPKVPKAQALSALGDVAEIGPADYILAVGDVALLALTLARALKRNGRATLLRWDSEAKNYKEQEIKE